MEIWSETLELQKDFLGKYLQFSTVSLQILIEECANLPIETPGYRSADLVVSNDDQIVLDFTLLRNQGKFKEESEKNNGIILIVLRENTSSGKVTNLTENHKGKHRFLESTRMRKFMRSSSCVLYDRHFFITVARILG